MSDSLDNKVSCFQSEESRHNLLSLLNQNEEYLLTPDNMKEENFKISVIQQKDNENLIRSTLAEKYLSDKFKLWNVTLLGRIVHIRKLSKRIMFLDLKMTDSCIPFLKNPGSDIGISHPELNNIAIDSFSYEDKIEVLFRSDEMGEELLQDCRYHLKVSDIVLIRGFLECSSFSYTLHALDIIMAKKRFWIGTSHTDAEVSLKSKISYQPEFPKVGTKDLIFTTSASDSRNKKREFSLDVSNQMQVDSSLEETKFCKFWINSKNCPKGSICSYFHPLGDELKDARKDWLLQRKKKRLELEPPFPDSVDKEHTNTQKNKSQRAREFTQFLIDTYGKEYLCSGRGILDIAGGRGEIAFELFTKLGFPVTLVDPRPRKLSKQQIRYLNNNLGSTLPPHIQDFFRLDDPTWNNSDYNNRFSLVIGMHPDQATEIIVDYGLKSSIPFAVVPCCVFSREFPGRTFDSKPVLTYCDLFNYLEKKALLSSNFRVASKNLNFEGRSRVLYTIPHL